MIKRLSTFVALLLASSVIGPASATDTCRPNCKQAYDICTASLPNDATASQKNACKTEYVECLDRCHAP